MVKYIILEPDTDEKAITYIKQYFEMTYERKFEYLRGYQVLENIKLVMDEEIYLMPAYFSKVYDQIPEVIRTKIGSLIHEKAEIPAYCTIGKNVRIESMVDIGIHTKIGNNVVVKRWANIAHDSQIYDGCVINTRATVAGNCKLGKHVIMQTGAVLREGICVGDYAIIECGAVVLKDVGAHEVVAGNPARIVKGRKVD